MKVAVLGAGMTGSLVALELAEAGYDVNLFDRQNQAFCGASLASEGKIHFGYVYALDRSLRTAKTMLQGATSFRPLIERWTGANLFARAMSDPYHYAVMRDSLLSVDSIKAHFHAVSDAMESLDGPLRLPNEATDWEQLSRRDYSQTFNPDRIQAVFRTEERAIDTAELANALRQALDTSPRIIQRMNCHINGVGHAADGYQVQGKCAGTRFAEPFNIVVNGLWEHRIKIDATLGLPTNRDVLHRFRYVLFTQRPEVVKAIPNVTFVIGPFGDTVAFPKSAFLSWYPVGKISQELALQPRVQDPQPPEAEIHRIISGTLRNLQRLIPGAAAALENNPETWALKGGFVTAWGRSGIEDLGSELHHRHDVGVFTHGDYHTIDTGKLTLAPMYAAEACARILAQHGTRR